MEVDDCKTDMSPTINVSVATQLEKEKTDDSSVPPSTELKTPNKKYSLNTQAVGKDSLSVNLMAAPQMSTLAAPSQSVSSVRTANRPKGSSSLNPVNVLASSSASATGNPRNKVALAKGRGLLDWIRLGNSTPDLAGTGGKLLTVTLKQLAEHNTQGDAWMALRGKVYNVTPYFEYHPGGVDELMRGVGKDATDLFNEVHKWVNFESMLQKCFVGFLSVEVTPSEVSNPSSRKPQKKMILPLLNTFARFFEGQSTKPKSASSTNKVSPNVPSTNALKFPPISNVKPTTIQKPTYDWYQSDRDISLNVYTHWTAVTVNHVTVCLKENKASQAQSSFSTSMSCHQPVSASVDILVREHVYRLRLCLFSAVVPKFSVSVARGGTGKVTIDFKKLEEGVRWGNIGEILPENDAWKRLDDTQREFHRCKIVSRRTVNHNSILLTVQCPEGVYMPVPTGYHTHLALVESGFGKPYTTIPATLDLTNRSVTSASSENSLYYLIKIYPDGAFTPLLDTLCNQPSEMIDVSTADGTFLMAVSEGKIQEGDDITDATYVAAGTGITPMLSMILDSLSCKRRIRLIYCNRTVEDIMLRDELDELQSNYPDLLKIDYVLSEPSVSWKGLKGRVNKEMLDKLLPIADGMRSVFISVCGPKGFNQSVLDILGELGYSREEYYIFEG